MTLVQAAADVVPKVATPDAGTLTPQIIVASAFGLTFVVTLIVLAIRFPRPTPFQYNVFRTVLSLAAAGLGATLPGFVSLNLTLGEKLVVRAGGALALFVLTYFFNPAKLAAESAEPLVPRTLPDSTPFPKSRMNALQHVWSKLLELESAGDKLWEKITEANLQAFEQKRKQASDAIRENGIFFSTETYDDLEDLLQASSFYYRGKTAASDMRRGQEQRRAQVQQNRRWLTRYKTLLRQVREGLHADSAVVG